MTSHSSPTIVLGVTDAVSIRLLRGHPEHLARAGWDVHVVAGRNDRPIRGATAHSISMRRDPAPLSDLRSLVAWVRLLFRLRPAVVVVGTPKAGLLGIVAAWLCRVPRRVYLLRGLRLEGATGLLSRVLWLTEYVACRLATDVLAVSPSLAAESVARRLVSAGRIHVLGRGSSNGVDVTEFRPPSADERAQARRAAGVAGDRLVIGYVGRVHEDKGIDTLLAAVVGPDLRDTVTLLIVGNVESESVRAQLVAHQAGAGASTVVMEHTVDVRSAMWAMDLLVLPSRREGFPNVVLEAAACGVPAVVSDATGCRDAVLDGETGWMFPVGQTEGLAAVLATVTADATALRRTGESARRWVTAEFSRQAVWERMDEYLASASGPTEPTEGETSRRPSRGVGR